MSKSTKEAIANALTHANLHGGYVSLPIEKRNGPACALGWAGRAVGFSNNRLDNSIAVAQDIALAIVGPTNEGYVSQDYEACLTMLANIEYAREGGMGGTTSAVSLLESERALVEKLGNGQYEWDDDDMRKMAMLFELEAATT